LTCNGFCAIMNLWLIFSRTGKRCLIFASLKIRFV
jgi:hypothetical protein